MAAPIKVLRTPTALPLGIGGRTRNFISVEVDERQMAAIVKKLESVRGKPMRQRLEKAFWAESDTLAKKMQQAAPRGPSGNLRKSIKARRKRRGVFSGAFYGQHAAVGDILVGPMAHIAPHRHLVIRGTGPRPIVSKRGRPSSLWRAFGGRAFRRDSLSTTGSMTANPFVDRAARGSRENVRRAVERAWFQTL